MDLDVLLSDLRNCPLVASAQADEGTPLDDPESIVRLALSSVGEGVRVVRLQGVANIQAVRAATEVPIIGLIKRHDASSGPYITPTLDAVRELLLTDCEVVGLDGTPRARPDGSTLSEAMQLIHSGGRLALADCDTLASVRYALRCGADVISTTLAGYTAESSRTPGPDLEFLREAIKISDKPVVGEGRYTQRWQVEAALRMGAVGAVVGGALNDPIKQTRALMPCGRAVGPVGAVDLGGTWLRFGLFDADWKLLRAEKVETPKTHRERAVWVAERVRASGACKVGISSGGTIDPTTHEVVETKPLIPDHLNRSLADYAPGISVGALNDGHATAWAHACLPQFAGRRVATLALGTGVGCGFVAEQRIWMGPSGEYPRLNDLPFGRGVLEDALGGFAMPGEAPNEALRAAAVAVSAIKNLWFPDGIVICGGVGLSPLLAPFTEEHGLVPSPFGEDAGLYGAAALALFKGWR